MKSKALWMAIVIAVVARGWVLLEAVDAPFWNAPKVDEVGFLQLAEQILQGESPPYGAYYVAPGYGYVLAGFLKLGVRDILWVKVFQLALGVVNALLLFHLTRRWFGAAAAVLAAAIWSLIPSVLMHEILLLKPTITVFLVLAALLSLSRPGLRARDWLAFGLWMGAAAIFRGEMLLVGVGTLGFLAWRQRPAWRHVGLGLVGLAAVVSIPTAQNLARGGGFVVVAYGGGSNFYIGNHPGADGSYRPLRPDRSDAGFEERDAVTVARNASGQVLDPAQVSRFWWGRGLAWWRLEPAKAVKLTLKKALLVWAWWEGSDVISTGIASRWVTLLGNPVVRAGVLFPLAWLGLFLTRRRSDLVLLRAFVCFAALSLVPFFIFERFRLPLLAACVPLASFAVVSGVTAWSRNRVAVLLGAVVAIGTVGLLTLPRVDRDENVLRVNVGGMLLNQGRYEEALEEFLAVRRGSPTARRVEINIANTYHLMGQLEEAIASLDRALEYLYAEGRGTGRPSVEEIVYCHELSGDIQLKRERPDLAARQFEAALQIAPNHPRLQQKLQQVRVP